MYNLQKINFKYFYYLKTVPPTISRESVELNPRLPQGRSLTLFCDVQAKPQPQIHWFLNGTRIDDSIAGRAPQLTFGDGRRFIQIANISLGHRGVYTCEAENTAGKDTIEYKVDVFEPPGIVKVKVGTKRLV